MRRPDQDRLEDSSRKLRLALRAARIGIWDWDLTRNEMNYSPRARSIFGFPDDGPVSFEMVRAATHPEDHPRTSAMSGRALDPATRLKEPYEYRIIRADTGEVRWVVAHGEAVFRGDGNGGEKAVRYVGTIEDITERKSIEHALRESERRQRLAIDAARMAVWEFSVAEDEIAATPELNRILGFDPAARPSIAEMRALFLPGERERLQAAIRLATQEGRTQFETEFRCRRPDGDLRWLLLRAEIVAGADGRPERIIGVLMDIDDMKRSEERQALLMRELNHRVKNSLSVIQALASQSFRRADPEALADFHGRLRALAAANDVLLENELRDFDLGSLVRRIIEPYAGDGTRFVLSGEAVTLPPRLNVPLALVLHELATNSAKYGALSRPDGSVAIGWTPAPQGTGLSWQETGGPAVAARPTKRFGMRLIEEVLDVEIGSVVVEFAETGVRCRIMIRHGEPPAGC